MVTSGILPLARRANPASVGGRPTSAPMNINEISSLASVAADGQPKWVEASHRSAAGRYPVIRSCIPNARVIRITVAKVGLPSFDSAL